jgi:hypothetical protein
MVLKNKNRFKPLYKQFITLRINVQNQKKYCNLKKKMESIYISLINRRLKIIKNLNH